MCCLRYSLIFLFFVALSTPARAGLYYSDERIAELPSQWRGFLIDLRILRNIAVKPGKDTPANPARERYQKEADRLEKDARDRKLTANELADLGALLVRLGEVDKAVEVLRNAHQQYPNHFPIIANLGTAWQARGDLDQAADCLRQAIRIGPEKHRKAEECQLRLVQFRQKQPRGQLTLDDLFDVRFVNNEGKFEPGKIAEAERKKLPADAVATVQQVSLWLPADGLLLWQLAELANAHGDIRTAASILDGCVSEFNLSDAELRRRRSLLRAAADELSAGASTGVKAKTAHAGHVGGIEARSKRPLETRFDSEPLPAIDPDGVNPLPWSVLSETTLGHPFEPSFAKYLRDLDGKRVALSGYMQPFSTDLEVASFMLIEYPVGCWYCENPEMTAILHVDVPMDKTANVTRSRIKVVGVLKLNDNDPENFLYTVGKAKVEVEE